jgi:ribulose-phosphate 3-epimerase
MILAPSLLSADFGNLERELAALRGAGISWAHWDVMDGMFVPNITFGPPVIRRLRRCSPLFFDVHLMIEAPERYLVDFAEAGADLLTIHAEASRHLDRTLREIRRLGMRSGLALNPSTPVSLVEEVLDSLDLVLIMSVNPGFGGQSFLPRSLDKVRDLAELLRRRNSAALIGVDGGVDPDKTGELTRLGADVLVSGSSFFSFPPYGERLAVFSAAAAPGRPSALFGLIP